MTPKATEPLERLADALRAEQQAVYARRAAAANVAQLMRELLDRGTKAFVIATRVSALLGLPPDVPARRRLAKMLVKRCSRAATGGHRFLGGVHGAAPVGGTSSSAKETTMPSRLVKRITEVFEEAPDAEGEDERLEGLHEDEREAANDDAEDDASDDDDGEVDDGDEADDEEEEEAVAQRRRPRRRAAR